MIISIFVIELHTQKKLFRSSSPMSQAQINHYLAEFSNISNDTEDVIEKDTYNFVYLTKDNQRFGMQISKDHSIKSAFSTLRFLIQNSTDDLFDSLVVIDNTLYGGLALHLELQPIIELDSQEEKIHKMMLENKRLEMAQREKENKMRNLHTPSAIEEPKPSKSTLIIEPQPKKILPSDKPVLVVIKEKMKIVLDKENNVKENVINGEVLMVISDAKYKQVEIKMKNLKNSFKYSPYLDKNALKKSIFRFDRERGINKSIPLLKWTGTRQSLPLTFDFWNDEEDNKYINIVDIKANVNIKNLQVTFSKENVTDIEINEEHDFDQNSIIWKPGNLKKDESTNIEIKCTGYDKDCLFPISVNFDSKALDSSIDVEKMYLEQEEMVDYEVRKELEIEHYQVVAE